MVPPNGEWRIGSNDAWRAVPPEPLGEYTALIKTIDGVTVLVTATFTVLARPTKRPRRRPTARVPCHAAAISACSPRCWLALALA